MSRIFMFAVVLLAALSASAQLQSQPFLYLSGSTPQATNDPTQPVTRGYIVPQVEPAEGGAKIIVELFQNTLNSEVTLSLQGAIYNPADKKTYITQIQLLGTSPAEPKLYYSRVEYLINYDQLNKQLQAAAPNAKDLKVGPGTALFVKADFPSLHDWGGYDRGGVIFLPNELDSAGNLVVPPATAQTDTPAGSGLSASALDIAYPITSEMINLFNDRKTGEGLSTNPAQAQVRSRVEGEGKFQLTEQQFKDIRKALLDISKDPTKLQAILGNGFTLSTMDRYMLKDANGQLQMDSEGFPTPDPMVDTYYDNAQYDAAKNDVAFRYRWTEGNKTGAWNFKPGIGRIDPQTGIDYRVEYGVDTTDKKPSSVAKYADSFHPLNVFQVLRQIIPNAVPSQFLQPSVQISDSRYKFKLAHSSGLIIEISLDAVTAESLRSSQNPAHYFQLEMDIDHLATASTNTVGNSGNAGVVGTTYKYSTAPNHLNAIATFMGALGAGAVFDGRPVIHTISDLESTSPLLVSRKADFDLAGSAIVKLRDALIGSSWKSGAQKYAFAAAALGLVPDKEISPSVKNVSEFLSATSTTAPAEAVQASANSCHLLFNQPTQEANP